MGSKLKNLETSKQFVMSAGSVILFSIIFPLIDKVSNICMIKKLYLGIPYCKLNILGPNDGNFIDWAFCVFDPLKYCQQNSKSINCHQHVRQSGYGTLLLGWKLLRPN